MYLKPLKSIDASLFIFLFAIIAVINVGNSFMNMLWNGFSEVLKAIEMQVNVNKLLVNGLNSRSSADLIKYWVTVSV